MLPLQAQGNSAAAEAFAAALRQPSALSTSSMPTASELWHAAIMQVRVCVNIMIQDDVMVTIFLHSCDAACQYILLAAIMYCAAEACKE